MKLIGMMPVRNEGWCLGLSLRVALQWCDEVVVLLHACTNESWDIVREIRREDDRLVVLADDSPEWNEMPMRQEMLLAARHRGATHLAIIDADEVLTGNLLSHEWVCEDGTRVIDPDMLVRAFIQVTPFNTLTEKTPVIVMLPGYNLRNGINQHHANGIWGNRLFSTAFADNSRLSWSGNTFHRREPQGVALRPYRPIQQGQGGILHLWGSSERRLIAKHALYKVTERLRNMRHVEVIEREYSWAIHGDKHWSSFGTPETWTYSPVPESWWAPYSHLMKYLDVDAEPWQEAEVRRLVAEHGREKFAGLDLFGVA